MRPLAITVLAILASLIVYFIIKWSVRIFGGIDIWHVLERVREIIVEILRELKDLRQKHRIRRYLRHIFTSPAVH